MKFCGGYMAGAAVESLPERSRGILPSLKKNKKKKKFSKLREGREKSPLSAGQQPHISDGEDEENVSTVYCVMSPKPTVNDALTV